MEILHVLGGILTAGLFFYLLFALLFPEALQ